MPSKVIDNPTKDVENFENKEVLVETPMSDVNTYSGNLVQVVSAKDEEVSCEVESDNEVENDETVIENLRKEHETLRKKYESDIENIKRENELLQSENAKKDSDINKLQDKINQHNINDAAHKKLEELREKVMQIILQNGDSFSKVYDRLNALLEDEWDVYVKAEKYGSTEEKLRNVNAQLKKAQSDLEEKSESYNLLYESYNNLRDEKVEFNNQLQEIENLLQKKEEDLENQREKLSNKETELNDLSNSKSNILSNLLETDFQKFRETFSEFPNVYEFISSQGVDDSKRVRCLMLLGAVQEFLLLKDAYEKKILSQNQNVFYGQYIKTLYPNEWRPVEWICKTLSRLGTVLCAYWVEEGMIDFEVQDLLKKVSLKMNKDQLLLAYNLSLEVPNIYEPYNTDNVRNIDNSNTVNKVYNWAILINGKCFASALVG